MELTKEQFKEWTEEFATQEFFKVVQKRIEDAKEILAYSAGNDSLNDRYISGMIAAFREVLDVKWGDE